MRPLIPIQHLQVLSDADKVLIGKLKELLRYKEMMKTEVREKLGLSHDAFRQFIGRITWYTSVYDDIDGTIGMLEFVKSWSYYCKVYKYRENLKGVKFYKGELKDEK